ncbi:hypothetical protein [Thermomonospora umbrina]|uniref:Uncharacterized protein n=1 Tax=Thermomonospora umbrina TaxID=111806 RepID=A0A3D9SW23_9ACTN|nr:hypothetical protein [Thermomonospora umbrina]REF00029.1 hypothetical protein DFJ69_5549 [Thermomonospora umbrina]
MTVGETLPPKSRADSDASDCSAGAVVLRPGPYNVSHGEKALVCSGFTGSGVQADVEVRQRAQDVVVPGRIHPRSINGVRPLDHGFLRFVLEREAGERMSEFDDMVAAERRRLDERKDANHVRQAQWRSTIERIQELLAVTVRALQTQDIAPLPVLVRTKRSFGRSDRVVIVDHRWRLTHVFELNERCQVFSPTTQLPGILSGGSKASREADRLERRRVTRRAGLDPDQRVLWPGGTLIELDPSKATGDSIHFFHMAGDGVPRLQFSDETPEPLDAYLAHAVANAANYHR